MLIASPVVPPAVLMFMFIFMFMFMFMFHFALVPEHEGETPIPAKLAHFPSNGHGLRDGSTRGSLKRCCVLLLEGQDNTASWQTAKMQRMHHALQMKIAASQGTATTDQ